MLTRQGVANFLQGLFVLPVCALLGGMVALLFGWQGARFWGCVGFCALFPLLGAIKTRQRALAWGLVAGLVVTGWGYWLLRP